MSTDLELERLLASAMGAQAIALKALGDAQEAEAGADEAWVAYGDYLKSLR